MTSCDKALRAAAEAWGGGPLPVEIRRHLETCTTCARERALTERLLEQAAGAPGRMPGEEPEEAYWATFGDRVRARLESAAPVRRTPARSFLRPVALAAAVVILGAAGAFFLWQREGPGAPAGSGGKAVEASATLRAIQEDPRTLEREMEEALRSAPEPVTLEELALLPSHVDGEALPGSSEDEADTLLSSEEALAQAGDMAALLAGRAESAWTDWSELETLVEGLSDQEAHRMIEELTPGRTDPSPAGA